MITRSFKNNQIPIMKHHYSLATIILLIISSIMWQTLAATTPNLGEAASFGVLSSTYTNIFWWVINGDLGFTTPSATATIVNGLIFSPKPPQAGIDQGAALTALASRVCSPPALWWWTDLASDITHGPVGVYEPWVYCVWWAADIGWWWTIILSGAGTYIFRVSWALNTSANSTVLLTNGASACDVFWTPSATTLGANSIFVGTIIDNAGITVGNNVTWLGRALNFATTVTTNNSTITVPTCTASATLHIIKQVINDNGWVSTPWLFSLSVKRFWTNVIWSPASGALAPGISYTLSPSIYTVSEWISSSYTQSFSGDCDINGTITLTPGSDKTCIIINNDIAPILTWFWWWGGGVLSIDNCPAWDYSSGQYDWLCWTKPITPIIPVVIVTPPVSILPIGPTPTVITGTITSITPNFPYTGIISTKSNSLLKILARSTAFLVGGILFIVFLRRRKIWE